MKKGHFLLLSYFVLMISGVLWGVREKVHATPDVFHQLFPKVEIAPVSFFGSKMWEMKDQPKSRAARQILNWFPINDFWHSSWYLAKSLLILGAWLAWKSGRLFWDFRDFWPLFLWVTAITMFWGGMANWIVSSIIR